MKRTLLFSFLLVACGSSDSNVDSGPQDSGVADAQLDANADVDATPPPPPPFICPTGHACYYFSTSQGDDNRSASEAQNQATPWKTITKLDAIFSTLKPGDYVAFARGETFPGGIVATASGASGSPITITSYGSAAAKPIITGFTTASSWTAGSSGLFTSQIAAGLPTLGMVRMNGAFQPMGRYPKTTASNAGYLTVQSHSGTTSITSTQLASIPSFVGGEIVWRPFHWVLWRGAVGAQTSSNVTYTPFPSTSGGNAYPAADGYGFFFQNHPNACTTLGEWSYDAASHRVSMFFGQTAPSSQKIEVSSVENLVDVTGRSWITFEGLAFEGANSEAFLARAATNVTIDACDISFSGHDALLSNDKATALVLTNNKVTYSNFNGFAASGATNVTITGNTIDYTASVAGMGGSGEGQYFGVSNTTNDSTITNNTIKHTGYIPLALRGTNNLVEHNVIDTFGYVKDDAGGIYVDAQAMTGTQIIGNVVMNGIGAHLGTPDTDPRANGIYADDGSSQIEVANNTVFGCGVAGYYNHNSFAMNVHDNTFFDNGSAFVYYNDTSTTGTLTVANNIAVAKTSSEWAVRASGGTTSISTWFSSASGNHYCRPPADTADFQSYIGGNTVTDLPGWKTMTGKEATSQACPVQNATVRFEYNPTSAPINVSLGSSTYVDVTGKSYAGSVTLAPFTSIVLFQTS
jgi:hypothetical protein